MSKLVTVWWCRSPSTNADKLERRLNQFICVDRMFISIVSFVVRSAKYGSVNNVVNIVCKMCTPITFNAQQIIIPPLKNEFSSHSASNVRDIFKLYDLINSIAFELIVQCTYIIYHCINIGVPQSNHTYT